MWQQLFKKSLPVFFIHGLTFCGQFLISYIVAKQYSKDSFGLFSYYHSLLNLAVSVAGFGYINSVTRHVSRKKDHYQPKAILITGVFIYSGINLMYVIFCYYFGELSALMSLQLFFGSTLLFIITIINDGILRANENFAYASFGLKGIHLAYCILLLFFSMYHFFPSINMLTFFHNILLLFLLGFSFWALSKANIFGQYHPDKALFVDSKYFWISSITTALAKYFDQIIIGAIDLSLLGDYKAVLTIFGGYEFISLSLSFVLLPHLNRQKEQSLMSTHFLVFFIAIAVSLGYLVFTKPVLTILYGNKYLVSDIYIYFLVLIGFLKILYILPSSLIGGKLSTLALRSHFFVSIVNSIVYVILLSLLVASYQVTGVLIATFIHWFLRYISTMIICKKYSTHQITTPEILSH